MTGPDDATGHPFDGATRDALASAARRISTGSGIAFTTGELDRLAGFVARIREWSTRVNLVSRRELPALVEKHVMPCLAPLLDGPLAGVAGADRAGRLLDIGSGGGLPGLVIAIVRPTWSVTLLEPIRKKTLFLQDAARGLDRVRVIRDRAETLAALPEHARRYDLITARAVGPPHRMWPLARPLLAPSGELQVFVAREQLPALTAQLRDLAPDVEVLDPIEPDWYPGAILRARALAPDPTGRPSHADL